MSFCSYLDNPIVNVLSNANKILNPFSNSDNSNSKWDIIECNNFYLLIADIPGINVSDIKIFVKNNTLTIEAEKLNEIEDNDKKYHFKEREPISFNRSMILPNNTSENVTASYKNGVLRVTISKIEEENPKQIKIKEE